MSSFKKLNTYISEQLSQGNKLVLASIVRVEGSAYRRPGAWMLFSSDGTKCGSISAGCLEADLQIRLQIEPLTKPQIIRYDSGADDLFELNLGCQGTIDVLVEPFTDQALTPASARAAAEKSMSAHCLATVIESSQPDQIGQRYLFDTYSVTGLDESTDSSTQFQLLGACKLSLQFKRFSYATCEVGERISTYFIDCIQPSINLIIFGTGNDVVPMVNMADELGWNTEVIGWKNKFPSDLTECNYSNLSDEPFRAEKHTEYFYNSAVVIMGHDYTMDKQFFTAIKDLPFRYIGVMGPKRRTERMLLEIDNRSASTKSDNLHFPIGLDIGADAPAEIAISILAEIQATFKNTGAGFLKNKTGAIHGNDSLIPLTRKTYLAASND